MANSMGDEQRSPRWGRREVIGARYVIHELLARGGTSTVYRATDARTCSPVAVKVLNDGGMRRSEAIEQFSQEVITLRSISHPQIVAYRDAGIHRGSPYCVMEYLSGPSLHRYVRDHGALAPSVALQVVRSIARGLETLHASGFVHRDVTASNVLLDMDGERIVGAKLVDLGLVHVSAAPEVQSPARMGTPGYMAPEQALTERIDPRTDVDALGTTLFLALTGELPFNGEHERAIATQVLAPMPRPSSEVEGLAAGIDTIVQTAARKNRGNRYASVHAMRIDLERALGMRSEHVQGAPIRVWPDAYQTETNLGQWLLAEATQASERLARRRCPTSSECPISRRSAELPRLQHSSAPPPAL